MVRPYALRYGCKLAREWEENDPRLEVRELILACIPFRNLLAKDHRVSFSAWDITKPWSGHRMHCIRAMNILNPGYFSADEFGVIVGNFMAALAEGGLRVLLKEEEVRDYGN